MPSHTVEARAKYVHSSVNPLIYCPHHASFYNSTHSVYPHVPKRTNRFREPHPLGVWNSGQSCHLSSTLTLLSSPPLLRALLSRINIQPNTSLYLLRHYLICSSGNGPRQRALDPRPLLSILEQTGWKSRHAQDAHETLVRMLDILQQGFPRNIWTPAHGLGASVEKVREGVCTSVVERKRGHMEKFPFDSVLSSRRQCLTCRYGGEESFQSSTIWTLPLVNNDVEIEHLIINSCMGDERLEMRCDGCGKANEHVWRHGVKLLPEILLLHVQRAMYFRSDAKQGMPGRVNLSKVLRLPVVDEDGIVRKIATYSLRGVVRHMGGIGRSSHFDCIVRRECAEGKFGLPGLGHGRWWRVDDGDVMRYEGTYFGREVYLVMYDEKRLTSVQCR